jgi:hypothetical protein
LSTEEVEGLQDGRGVGVLLLVSELDVGGAFLPAARRFAFYLLPATLTEHRCCFLIKKSAFSAAQNDNRRVRSLISTREQNEKSGHELEQRRLASSN